MTRPDTTYLTPGPMTEVGRFAGRVAEVPGDLPTIVEAVQGLLVHEFLGPLYGIEIDPGNDEVDLHRAEDVLALAGDAPLTEPRAPSERVPSNCRQFSVVTTAILRAHGIGSRARCGFGAYFNDGYLEDHWVVEVRDPDSGRWRLVDAQVDDVQRSGLRIDVDTFDVPRDAFVVAGDAWLGFRAGTIDADRCGLSVIDEHGDWWIAGNLLRDVASLLGVETRPWDVWGAMREPGDPIPPADVELFDELATLTVGGGVGGVPSSGDIEALRAIEARDERVRVPETVYNHRSSRFDPLPGRR